MKPFEAVKRTPGRSLFIFEHGLGDLINFLPVWYEFMNQTGIRCTLGASEKRQFNLINENIVTTSKPSIDRRYTYKYKVLYPDPKNTSIPIEISEESAKPYICAFYELGMNPFIWKPYQMLNKWKQKDSKRIGVHLFGHTGMNKKFCPVNVAEEIWQEIIDAGYEPFECHMTPDFADEYPDFVEADSMDCISEDCSLRFEKPDLEKMIKEIGKCKFFIGVDSGPIYLASALLGVNNIIGLENQKKHNNFIPKHIITVPVLNYKSGTIYKQIKFIECIVGSK
jgi:ADP-heptose:LPS heptosyltransferase